MDNELRTPAERAMDDLRDLLEGSDIRSNNHLIVAIKLADRGKRMNLLGLLANIRDKIV